MPFDHEKDQVEDDNRKLKRKLDEAKRGIDLAKSRLSGPFHDFESAKRAIESAKDALRISFW
jgi:hypothetical protein